LIELLFIFVIKLTDELVTIVPDPNIEYMQSVSYMKS